MKPLLLRFIFILVLPAKASLLFAQAAEQITVQGIVTDEKTGEVIVGATITAESNNATTTTDRRGRYTLNVTAGFNIITGSYLGYEKGTATFTSSKDYTLNLQLTKASIQLSEVDITTTKPIDDNLAGVQSGITTLQVESIKKMPAFLGEVDVVKSIKLLPGVSSIGEAATGFNVRGGSTDQNLVLLDGAPIFNTSHLFGFFSVFNPNAIDNMTLYRGGMPAQFGGRISSVLDVEQREGNYEKYQVNGGIGIVSGRLAVEGPIVKDKTSFLLAGRSSYSNWVLRQVRDVSVRNSRASFYDVSAKLGHVFNTRNKLTLSGYRSSDDFGFSGDTIYAWASTAASIKYSHTFNRNLNLDVGATYSKYDFRVNSQEPNNASEFKNGILYQSLYAAFAYRQGRHRINFGGSFINYELRQGELKPDSEISQILPVQLHKEHALESALYWNDEVRLSQKLSFMYGLRYAAYANYGAGEVYLYQPEVPKQDRTITDTVNYSAGEVIKLYHGLEPRFSLNYSISAYSSVKLGYNRNRQYIHLISNTASVSPLDSWKSSNTYFKPQIGDQFSLGYFRNFRRHTIETSVEAYYKRIRNMLDYKNGAELFLNKTIEADLLPGKGRAYGIETSISKKTGKLTGWLSYTYARTEMAVKGATPEETINGGAYYPANYDKPHTLNLVGSYQRRKRVLWSANFTYSTGRPITAPLAHYVIDDYIIPDFGERNQYRIPDYHRLDLSMTILPNPEKEKKWEGSWNIAIYNVYGRKNPYSVFFKQIYGSPPRAYQVAVVGVPLPSVSYDFKF